MFRDHGHPQRLPILSFIFGLLVLSALGIGKTDRAAFLVTVDLQVSKNSSAEVFWNDFQDPPVRRDVTGGARQTLEFPLPPVSLHRFRIDPTELAAETVVIYGISIRRLDDGMVTKLPPEAIAGWIGANIADFKLNSDSATFRTTANDPYLVGPVEIAVPWRDAMDARVQKYLHSDIAIAHLALFTVVFASLLCFGLSRFLPIAAGYLLALFAFLYFLDPLFAYLGITTSYDVASAVGHAALNGVSVDAGRWGSLIAGALTIGLGIACGYLLKAKDLDTHTSDTRRRTASSAARIAAVLIWLGAIFLVLAPDLPVLAWRAANLPFVPHWDNNNGTAWMGLIARGERPFVDFFYPYSGLWTYYYLPLPYGPIVRWIYMTLLYGATGVVIWRLVKHRFGFFGFAFAALVVLLAEASVLNQPERYLLSTAVALAYIAIDRDRPLGSSGRVWFWLLVAVAAWGEPYQIVYAGPALLIAWILSELPLRTKNLPAALKRAVLDFAVPALTLLGLIAFYAWRGELDGLIESYIQGSGHWTYAVIPVDLRSQLQLFSEMASPALFGSFFLIFLGTLRVWHAEQTEDAKLDRAILCCGLIGLMLFQKHWIRWIFNQTYEPMIIGSLLIIPLCWYSVRSRVVVAFLAGALVVTLVINDRTAGVASRAVDSYSRLTATLRTLLRDRQLIETANNQAFARERFVNYGDELAVADRVKALGKRSLFVDGDMPIFYLFSSGPVPFQFNQFSGSPIRAQLQVEKWLEEKKPEVAIVDLNSPGLDNVQYVVRLPIVAIKAMLDFVPREKVGHYFLLDRRADSEPVALDFWRNVYGPVLNYGHIIGYSKASRLPACAPPAQDCSRYLKIAFHSGIAAPEKISVPIEVGSSDFEVTFFRVPGRQEYFLSLDRIWFWVLADSMGLSPKVRFRNDVAYDVEIVGRSSPRPMLY
jgi:hypothetical protein